MRVAVIYRPKNSPPLEQMPGLLEGMTQWIERYGDRIENLHFFVAGGGTGFVDVDDAAELHRMLAEHPFTVFADVEVRPVVDAKTALRNLQEAFAARAASQ
jgi:nucleoside-diphosphate-sugar epimerase